MAMLLSDEHDFSLRFIYLEVGGTVGLLENFEESFRLLVVLEDNK